MEIQSKQLASQQVNPDSIITFPQGIPGFEDQTRFKLLQQQDSEIVYYLQSVDDESLEFPVASPTLFNINYSFLLSDAEEQLLQLSDSDDLLILIMLHKNELTGEDKPTVKGSIKAPLLINSEKRIGFQKLLAKMEQSITLSENSSEIDVSEA